VTRETRFAKTPDGVHLAYQVVGSGPVDVVMDFHAFAGDVDLIWDEPDWGPLLAQLPGPVAALRRRTGERCLNR
jgi:hypothetical protein